MADDPIEGCGPAADLHGIRVLHVDHRVTTFSLVVAGWQPGVDGDFYGLGWLVHRLVLGRGLGEDLQAEGVHPTSVRDRRCLGGDFFLETGPLGHRQPGHGHRLSAPVPVAIRTEDDRLSGSLVVGIERRFVVYQEQIAHPCPAVQLGRPPPEVSSGKAMHRLLAAHADHVAGDRRIFGFAPPEEDDLLTVHQWDVAAFQKAVDGEARVGGRCDLPGEGRQSGGRQDLRRFRHEGGRANQVDSRDLAQAARVDRAARVARRGPREVVEDLESMALLPSVPTGGPEVQAPFLREDDQPITHRDGKTVPGLAGSPQQLSGRGVESAEEPSREAENGVASDRGRAVRLGHRATRARDRSAERIAHPRDLENAGGVPAVLHEESGTAER